jgi:hypothetical protein
LVASPLLAVGLAPLVFNWHAASRAGQTDTRDFAADLLNSVEPYGVLVTVGDNDTFPLWYAQEVEGVRKDVLVANTSLMNTDWYVRQMLRRPVFPYDEAKGPAIYRGKAWAKPSGPPLHMTLEQADAIVPYIEVREPLTFRKETPRGTIVATIQPSVQILERAELIVLQMIKDAFPERPIYISRTSGGLGEKLGLRDYLLTQGLARKLMPAPIQAGKDTINLARDGWVDLRRSEALWDLVFVGPKSVMRRGDWVDAASSSIPLLYVNTALDLAEAADRRGAKPSVDRYVAAAKGVARAIGVALQ